MIVNVASNPLLTRLSNAATFAVKPQSRRILTCMIDQVSQAAAKMVLFFNVPSGDNAKSYNFNSSRLLRETANGKRERQS